MLLDEAGGLSIGTSFFGERIEVIRQATPKQSWLSARVVFFALLLVVGACCMMWLSNGLCWLPGYSFLQKKLPDSLDFRDFS